MYTIKVYFANFIRHRFSTVLLQALWMESWMDSTAQFSVPVGEVQVRHMSYQPFNYDTRPPVLN